MPNDEQAIRDLVEQWMNAIKTGEVDTVLNLMADDVIFMVPGKEPFGKNEFAALSQSMKNVQMEGHSEIQEIQLLGDWAWMRNRLEVTIKPLSGPPVTRSGYTLTVLKKSSERRWVIFRDANLLTEKNHL